MLAHPATKCASEHMTRIPRGDLPVSAGLLVKAWQRGGKRARFTFRGLRYKLSIFPSPPSPGAASGGWWTINRLYGSKSK